MQTQVSDNVLYELLQRVAKRHHGVCRAFFAMHETIYNRAKGLLRDGNEAAHIAQGVFVEIWQRAPFCRQVGLGRRVAVGLWHCRPLSGLGTSVTDLPQNAGDTSN